MLFYRFMSNTGRKISRTTRPASLNAPVTAAGSLRHEGILLVVVLIWGVNFPIIKHAVSVMHPFVLNVFRFIVSGLFLSGILLFRNRREGRFEWRKLRSHWQTIALLGLLGYLIYQVLFILGIERTTSGNSALIMASSPTWTAIVAFAFGFERLRALAWFGLLLSILGTALIVFVSNDAISLKADYFVGNLLTVGASASWGAYTAFSKPMTRYVDPLILTLCGLIVAFPGIVMISMPYFEQIDWSHVTLWIWGAIIYSGGLSTGVAVVLWTQAIQRVGATHTAVYGNLVPLVALLGGVILLNETITFMQVLGGICIIGGLVLMRRDRKKNE